jgi:hypothetical protein
MTPLFLKYGTYMLRGGYSPVPIRPGEKRPLMDKWDRLRVEPLTPAQIEALARKHPDLGLGVAGGYMDLVPVDVDTEDREAIRAARSVLPPTVVAKKGNRGFTTFYRGKVRARKFKSAEKKPLVEILATGQTLLPPTLHPDTGKPYQWLTKATLFTTSVDRLPTITEGHIQLLEKTLEPWLPKRIEPATTTVVETTPVSTTRMQAYARKVLEARANELAGMVDGGRNEALFRAACCVGKFEHHKVIPEGEVERVLLGACDRNDLKQDDGERQCLATIRQGLKKSKDDKLPTLKDRPREERNASILH